MSSRTQRECRAVPAAAERIQIKQKKDGKCNHICVRSHRDIWSALWDWRDRLHVATAAKQQVGLPCHHHPPTPHTPTPSSEAFTKATKTCQTNTRACAPSLRCRAYFQPSTNVQLADTNVLQTAQREPKKARQRPVHSSVSKTNLTLTREKYDRLWNTDKDRNVSVVLTKATILAILRNSFVLKGQILLQ